MTFTPKFNIKNQSFSPKFSTAGSGGGGEGTRDYNLLFNKPSIDGVILEGNRSIEELHLQTQMRHILESEIDRILYPVNEGGI